MLKDKVMLVTGASAGIGRAVALVCAREGAKLVLSDLNVITGEETAALVRKQGAEAIFVVADVGKSEDSKMLVDKAMGQFGRLDLACNNAGIGGVSAATADYPLEAWDSVIQINLSGVFYGMQQQLKAMLKNGGGVIINIASVLGAVALARSPAYTAAKHGVVGLTQAAAIEYGAQNIRINAVGPGFIRTAMTSGLEKNEDALAMLVAAHPIGRLGKVEEVAELVAWLASDKASFVTGAYYPVDGGYLAR
jgi:NAD(P)-dependent dehydrogenase (short-subunit alcohol dehydrogenase family)